MTDLILGKFEDGGGDAVLDLDALIGTHLCIQANSGGGKSGTIRRLLEITHGKLQHIVLDVEDEFYTLREKFEYMIAGGDNGDCAATVNNADKLSLMILKTGFSAIVQINGLSMDDRREFIGRFLTALINAPKDLWRPALVILDEAQSYAPQVGKVESSDGVLQLMTLGRKRGFTGVLATPRAASIHKDVTGPVNNWLMGRVGQPADRRAVADALGFSANSAEARGLQKLVRREFWAFGPALCTEPLKMKVGAIETTAIKAGQFAPPAAPAPAAMRRILAEMNAAAKDEEAALPIVSSKSGSENGSQADKQALAEEYRRGFGEGELIGYAAGYETAGREIAASARQALEVSRDLATELVGVLTENIAATAHKDSASPPIAERDLRQARLRADGGVSDPVNGDVPPPQNPPRAAAPDDGSLAGAAVPLLAAFARYRAGLTWDNACVVACMIPGNGYFYKGKRALVEAGLVKENDGIAKLTEEGVEKAGGWSRPLKLSEIVAQWKAKAKAPGGVMLEYIANQGARWIDTDELAGAIGTQAGNGYWYKGVKSIREAGLIEHEKQKFRPSEFLREAR